MLLDTHVLLWLMSGDNKLGKKNRRLIDEAYHQEEVAVSAISFWEIAMLKNKQRIELNENVIGWRKQLLRQGLIEFHIDGEVSVFSTTLDNFHADPADRFIVSSAILNSATLLTADGKILNWKGNLKRFDARK